MKTLPIFQRLANHALVILAFVALSSAPAPARAAGNAWIGEYFANEQLAGTPAVTRSDPDLNFNWGWGSPAPAIPVDHFTARWTRTANFSAGQWRFNVDVDDGVRFYVDGQPVIDQWRITAPITYTSTIPLAAGDHTLRLEYWENTERAQVRLWWEQGSAGPASVPAPAPQAAWPGTWRGQYYDDRDLSDSPTFERDDSAVYFDWGTEGPGGGIGGQNYSVRWTRQVYFPGATYRFKVWADDGVRLWFDWKAVIDEWHDSSGKLYTREMDVSTGNHTLVVEYYQAGGGAQIQAEWENTAIDWVGNLHTCLRQTDSWIKVYRLTPNQRWEDLKPAGYGPLAANGNLDLYGVPIDAMYGWDGQPYMVQLWVNGAMTASNGDIFAGQPAMRLVPGGEIRTSWACGAAIPTGSSR